ncbi:MAG: hypothetical protein F6K39_15790 [Okeania sp. SIO3B3]|nr:hypothetical protein [Okeania sp. SIO3B3]
MLVIVMAMPSAKASEADSQIDSMNLYELVKQHLEEVSISGKYSPPAPVKTYALCESCGGDFPIYIDDFSGNLERPSYIVEYGLSCSGDNVLRQDNYVNFCSDLQR